MKTGSSSVSTQSQANQQQSEWQSCIRKNIIESVTQIKRARTARRRRSAPVHIRRARA